MLTPLIALVRKDLQLFFSDRRAVIMSFAVPIAIASFFGSIFSGPSKNTEPVRIAIVIVDQDQSAISKAIVTGASEDKNLRVTADSEDAARAAVRAGKQSVGVIIPAGFGEKAGTAFFGTGEKPPLNLLYDPTKSTELAMVRGVLTEHIMSAVSRAMFGGEQGRRLVNQTIATIGTTGMPADQRASLTQMLQAVQSYYNTTPAVGPGSGSGSNSGSPGDAANSSASAARTPGITMPYEVHEQAMTSGQNVQYNGYSHSFAGMGIQFLLFAAANLGVEVLIERQRGLWKRLRSAPLGRFTLLTAKVISITIISLLTLFVSFGFAMIVFHVTIDGSLLGFGIVSLTCAMMAATFGLLVAALGRTPGSARGVTTLAVLMMVMLGGAWVPSFVFPSWLQTVTLVVPARWAVDGLDSMTWRGAGLTAALMPSLVLLGFATLFGAIAFLRFPWEEA
jgi:ABC-2 type transport system permease protein